MFFDDILMMFKFSLIGLKNELQFTKYDSTCTPKIKYGVHVQ